MKAFRPRPINAPVASSDPQETALPFHLRALSAGLKAFAVGIPIITLWSIVSLWFGESVFRGPTTALTLAIMEYAIKMDLESVGATRAVAAVMMVVFGVLGTKAASAASRSARADRQWAETLALLTGVMMVVVLGLAVWKTVSPDELTSIPAGVALAMMVAALAVYGWALARCMITTHRSRSPRLGAPRAASATGRAIAAIAIVLTSLSVKSLAEGYRDSKRHSTCKVVLAVNALDVVPLFFPDGPMPNSVDDLTGEPVVDLQGIAVPPGTGEHRHVYLFDFLRSPQLVEEYWDCLTGPNGVATLSNLPEEAREPGPYQKSALVAALAELSYEVSSTYVATGIPKDRIPVLWDARPGHGPDGVVNAAFIDRETRTMTREEFDANIRTLYKDQTHLFVRLIERGGTKRRRINQ